MNIEKLIIAAEEIDALAAKSEERSKAWRELAADAKAGLDRAEINRRRMALDSCVVIDFGTAIEKLRSALQSKATKGKTSDAKKGLSADDIVTQGYYWWLPECNREQAQPADWTIIRYHKHDSQLPKDGIFIGPLVGPI